MSNAGWNAFSTFWSIAISFIIAPLLISNMGTDQYGILLLIWSVTGILGLVGFGFGEATLKYIASYFGEGDTEGVNRIIGATLSLYLVVSIVVGLVVFAAAPFLVGYFTISAADREMFGWLLRLAALVFGLRIISLTYAAVPMALQRYDIGTKVAVIQSVARTVGYVALAWGKFSVLHLVIWDVIVTLGTVVAQAFVIRWIASGVRLLPSFSFKGLREIAGFSTFSFLTYGFHMVQRESAKMILGSHLGPSPVAYLGTPDSVALRLHMVVASGSETLMPRFSANRDRDTARELFVSGTWASLAISLVLLLPLFVLLPDLLRLWINPEFAAQAGAVGQLVALSYISQGAYAPAATYFRGTGRPGVVTVAILFAGVATFIGSLALIPSLGLVGVGYAYLIGSLPAFAGVIHCWYHMVGRGSTAGFLRIVGLPMVMGAIALALSLGVRGMFGEIGWISLFGLGGIFVVLTAALIGAADWLTGRSDAPSRQFVEKLAQSDRINLVFGRLLPLRAR